MSKFQKKSIIEIDCGEAKSIQFGKSSDIFADI